MQYGYDDYNQYNILKVPRLLVIVNLYLLKQLAFFLLPMLSSLLFLNTFKYHHFHIALMASSLPAIVVMISMMQRGPVSHHPFLLVIWKYGRKLLLLNLALELIILSLFLYLGTKQLNGVTLMFLYVDMSMMVYLLRSKRIKDVFSEYYYRKEDAS